VQRQCFFNHKKHSRCIVQSNVSQTQSNRKSCAEQKRLAFVKAQVSV
jgi:hypothetical protein